MNRWRAFVVVLGVAGLTVGCSSHGGSGSTPGSALPAPAGQNASAPGLPYAGAPRVNDPLPASVLSGDPCTDALTPHQVAAALGAEVPGKREDLVETGPACAWSNHDTGGAVGVSYTVNTHVGLSGVYAGTRYKALIWKVLPDVQGFPAVAHAGQQGEELPTGFCQASIGLADDLSIDVSLTLGSSKKYTEDACGLVPQIADMAVTTLRAKAGS